MSKRPRLNLPDGLLTALVQREFASKDKGHWIEAVSLQMFVSETILRATIRNEVCARLTKGLVPSETYANYWNEERFNRLISNYLLLGGDTKLVALLRKYSERRGKIIHELDSFSDLKSVDIFAEETYRMGEKIYDDLLRAYNESGVRMNQMFALTEKMLEPTKS